MSEIVSRVLAALANESRIDLHHYPINASYGADDVLTLAGEVGNIIAKKLALRIAAAASGARGIVDHLHVRPSERRGDGEIRDWLCRFIENEPVFQNCALSAMIHGQAEMLRDPDSGDGRIAISVEDGIITLDGEVISLSHKRLAGAIAWWTPGCRDVVNGLEVSPSESDSDDEICDALRITLEKDPLVIAEQIQVQARNSVVTLRGLVRNQSERHLAELDAWYMLGIDQVENLIECRE